ncbi:glycosyltransferase [Massilia sp. TS11]|uniref:glycosyltransferase n=1 Tax=Massilia sp. TS11 TaxID=2908003 RepID=UPI001EDABB90|nr:glycosyltransferase [Massilia sp. TS11]MCG2583629.1 glycosyltransferase [Massilia sp. TS11]
MQILFVHQNFPAQFRHLAPAVAARDGHAVHALGLHFPQGQWMGVHVHHYACDASAARPVHPWLGEVAPKLLRAEAGWQAARQLRAQGLMPELIYAHPGWGDSLFLREVWPQARLRLYCEYHYPLAGGELDFDPEFAANMPDLAIRMRLRNLSNTLSFEQAEAGLAPTHWQAQQFPESFRSRIQVIHDGIDSMRYRPRADVALAIPGLGTLTRADEVITFVARTLEPYRGYHSFMRSLPALLAARPRAQVLIVGADEGGYGPRPPSGQSWKQIFALEVLSAMPEADQRRIHFLGTLAPDAYLAVLQLSRVHVHLSYPFVLSWSLLEAMSCGCAVVASDTAPVRECIAAGEQGLLVDFFDYAGLAQSVQTLLDDRAFADQLGARARARVEADYDLHRVCLPAQLEWLEN